MGDDRAMRSACSPLVAFNTRYPMRQSNNSMTSQMGSKSSTTSTVLGEFMADESGPAQQFAPWVRGPFVNEGNADGGREIPDVAIYPSLSSLRHIRPVLRQS